MTGLLILAAIGALGFVAWWLWRTEPESSDLTHEESLVCNYCGRPDFIRHLGVVGPRAYHLDRTRCTPKKAS